MKTQVFNFRTSLVIRLLILLGVCAITSSCEETYAQLSNEPSIVGTWKCVGYYWENGVDLESDHIYVFNEDGTGAFADKDSYLHPTTDQLVEYVYDDETSTLTWRYTHPVEEWKTQTLELEDDTFTIHLYEEGHEWWVFEKM